jgi:hypothetical protein
LAGGRGGAQLDDGADDLAQVGVGQPDDGDGRDRRVLVQHLLEVGHGTGPSPRATSVPHMPASIVTSH